VSASTHTVSRKLLDYGLVYRRAAKKPYLSQKKKHQGQQMTVAKLFSDEALFRLIGTSRKSIVWRRKGEHYH